MSAWDITREERKKFLPYIKQSIEDLKQERILDVYLDGLNPSKASELLKELGYEQVDFDTNGWEMDFWITFSKPGDEPNLVLAGCGYTFDLSLHLEE